MELPVEWVRDDAAYFWKRSGQSVRPCTLPGAMYEIFRRECDAAYHEGALFQLTMHPHVIGYRSRMWILEELIRHARQRGNVWFATHADVVDWACARRLAVYPALNISVPTPPIFPTAFDARARAA